MTATLCMLWQLRRIHENSVHGADEIGNDLDHSDASVAATGVAQGGTNAEFGRSIDVVVCCVYDSVLQPSKALSSLHAQASTSRTARARRLARWLRSACGCSTGAEAAAVARASLIDAICIWPRWPVDGASAGTRAARVRRCGMPHAERSCAGGNSTLDGRAAPRHHSCTARAPCEK